MVDFRNFEPDEEKIANLFRLHWKLNFARVQEFKKKLYPFLFVQADEETERIFNIKEDLVILFLRSEKFDDKDLNFFDETYQRYSNRIDERILILVSRDEKIRREIERIASERMHTRLTIPYTYKELLETKEDVGLRKKLEKIYYGKDLYSYDNPLTNDTFFFGRTEITKEIINEYDLGKSFGLFGLRRLGKTSVLFSVRRQLSVRKKLSVYFNFQNPSLQQKKWYELLQFISQTIQIEISDKIDESFIDVELVEYNERNAAEEFKADLEFFRKKIGDKILICFDEIEQISPKTAALSHWKSGTDTLFFWQTLRYVIEENRELIGLLIAGTNPLLFEAPFISISDTEKVDNSVYRFISPKYLDFFTLSDQTKMIVTLSSYAGLYFEQQVFTYLFDDYGGHPFLTRKACSEINKIVNQRPHIRPFTITRDFYRDNKSRIEIAVSDYSKMLLDVLKQWYPKEYDLLENLAIGNENEFNQLILEDSLIIQHLLGYKILNYSNDRYRITIDCVRNYLIRNSNKILSNSDIDDRWKILVVERGKVERQVRKLIREKSKILHGHKEATRKLIDVLGHPRNTTLANFKVDEILADDTKHVYFRELKLYIEKNWLDYKMIFFDKTQFSLYMDEINRYRNDAHGNDIDQDDLTKVIAYCRWITDKIENF